MRVSPDFFAFLTSCAGVPYNNTKEKCPKGEFAMRCKACGAENADWLPEQVGIMRFCVNCGVELEQPNAEAQPESVPPQRSERRKRSAPNPEYGGDLAPAVTLGGSDAAYTPPPTRPSVPPTPPTPPVPPRKTDEIYMPKPKPKKSGIGWLIGVLIGIALLAAGYFFVHIWEPATCEAPETCKICGKTRGEKLDHEFEEFYDGELRCSMCGQTACELGEHDWENATCTKPKTCRICGETEGSALDHEWIDATYDAPKTCRLCGATEGDVLGWVGAVPSTWQSGEITIAGCPTTPKQLNQPLVGCRRMTVEVQVSVVSGDPYGTHRIFVHNAENGWFEVKSFSFTPEDAEKEIDLEIMFYTPTDVDAVAHVMPSENREWDVNHSLSVFDVQVY